LGFALKAARLLGSSRAAELELDCCPFIAMQITALARQVARLLAEHNKRVVFAESCTAGLASATLSRIPGISQWHCGSAVTYREETKVKWLQVRSADIRRESAVSETVARQMARGVLEATPEADISAAVTGHLGPDAPPDLDGVVFVCVASRRGGQCRVIRVERLQLSSTTRYQRQREAVRYVFRCLIDSIE